MPHIRPELLIRQSFWHGQLNDTQNEKLSTIKFDELLNIFGNSGLNNIESLILNYIDENAAGESICGVFFMQDQAQSYLDEKTHNHPLKYSSSTFKYCFIINSIIIQRDVIAIFEKRRRSLGHIYQLLFDQHSLSDGCANKIFKMIELSSRLSHPSVANPDAIKQSRQLNVSQKCIEKEEIIHKIQPYGFYVEANVDCQNKINFFLNQVIETTTEEGRSERSTLSIIDYSCKITDMYESLSESLWNSVQQQPQFNLHGSNYMGITRYNEFKVSLVAALQGLVRVYVCSFTKKSD